MPVVINEIVFQPADAPPPAGSGAAPPGAAPPAVKAVPCGALRDAALHEDRARRARID